jgi:hypothetical protein
MAAGRHNLTRRALLGAGAAAPLALAAAEGGAFASASLPPFGVSFACPEPVEGSNPSPRSSGGGREGRGGLRQARPERAEGEKARARWSRTLAAYRRAEARVAAFEAAESTLPPERRAFPASEPLEEELGRLDGLRTAALRRLLRLPAPDIAALALKLELAVADQAWELAGCETCLPTAAADARRLAEGAPANSSA